MSLAAAVWCVACGAPPTVTVTLERNGTLAHYGSCWDHVATVAARARADAERIDRARATTAVVNVRPATPDELEVHGLDEYGRVRRRHELEP